jgi:hypothetical protein
MPRITIRCNGQFTETKANSSIYNLVGHSFECNQASIESLEGHSAYDREDRNYTFQFTIKTSEGEFRVHHSKGAAPFQSGYEATFYCPLPCGTWHKIEMITLLGERDAGTGLRNPGVYSVILDFNIQEDPYFDPEHPKNKLFVR